MSYSNARLRKALATVRILTGLVFASVGLFKITSLEFARVLFPQLLQDGLQGAAVDWVRPVLEWIVSNGPGWVAVGIGFTELFIGMSLVLGLAVRPAAVIGMIYSLALLLATWNQLPQTPSMLQTADHQLRNVFPFLVFLLLGVGHAGETWGLGSVYHHHRAQKWQRENPPPPENKESDLETETEQERFEAFLEREERAMAETEHVWREADQDKSAED